ncbi:MAG: hypothetical protein ABW005_14550 [Burkholderiaceae bacterium]
MRLSLKTMVSFPVHGVVLAAALLAAAGARAESAAAPPPAAAAEAAPQAQACPSGLPADLRCLGGLDSAGAHYLIAMPKDWNGRLVLHAHGGPFLGAPSAKRVAEDLQRWSLMVRAGYAWAASSYHQGGVALTAAAEDTERLRKLFIAQVARPKLTLLHGQSWGAGVAAKAAELYTRDDADGGRRPYDAVLLSSGVLGGGTRSYDFRLDLRVVYQYLCANHPRPDEAQYPLWMGQPAGTPVMKNADLQQRANECLGLDKPAEQRSAAQARKLKTLLAVIKIPERTLVSHLSWATGHFQDIVRQRTAGANAFGNVGVRYSGSDDDAALNAGVLRYAADPAAVAAFDADAGLTGRIPVPVLTVHAIHDPTAFVELQHSFGLFMEGAGQADHLVQTYTDDHEHSYLSDASYAALLDALQAWTERGVKPTPASVAEGCVAAQKRFPSTCRFRPDYQPPALETREPAR